MKYLIAFILLVVVVGFVLLVPVGIWKACAAAEERKYGKALAWLLPTAFWILITLASAYIRFLQLAGIARSSPGRRPHRGKQRDGRSPTAGGNEVHGIATLPPVAGECGSPRP